MNASTAVALLRDVPPWIDLDALARVLDHAAAEVLFWADWQGPHAVDGVECPPLPAAQQEAATWARDNALIADESAHCDDGRVYCLLTRRGRDYRDALRHRGSA
ncbi:hypothetical protein [Actinokineospora sp. NPDC004072]